MISNTVINNNKLAFFPFIDTSIILHEVFKILNEFLRNKRSIFKDNSMSIFISLIYPSGVSSQDLVVESFFTISANLNSREKFRNNFAVESAIFYL